MVVKITQTKTVCLVLRYLLTVLFSMHFETPPCIDTNGLINSISQSFLETDYSPGTAEDCIYNLPLLLLFLLLIPTLPLGLVYILYLSLKHCLLHCLMHCQVGLSGKTSFSGNRKSCGYKSSVQLLSVYLVLRIHCIATNCLGNFTNQ